jgi:hypothetical protein
MIFGKCVNCGTDVNLTLGWDGTKAVTACVPCKRLHYATVTPSEPKEQPDPDQSLPLPLGRA